VTGPRIEDADHLSSASRAVAGSSQDRVRSNERLTGSFGVVLFALFAAEGLTILLQVRSTLPTHVFIGMLLVPPVLAKTGTTGYRFTRYYLGDPDFVDRGPPMWILRLAGPFVVLTSVAVLATGIADAVLHPRPAWVGLSHKASFVLWFGFMTIHVLGHIRETPTLAAADWRRGPAVAGRARRTTIVTATLLAGVGLGIWSTHWNLHG
jgi:hypothetical protein